MNKRRGRLDRLSRLCLALPETSCQLQGDHARFLVRDKTFTYYLNNHHGDGVEAVCCKVALGENRDLTAAQPGRYLIPAYLGPRGWVSLRLDIRPLDWDEVDELVRASYRLVAPRRLLARLTD